MSDRAHTSIKDVLHGVRSSLAGAQAEAELLEMDGVDVARVTQMIKLAIMRIATAEELAPTHNPDSAPNRLVLLEDDEMVGTALLRRLRRAGYDCCLVLDVEAALAWANTGAHLVADLTALETASTDQRARIQSEHPVVLTGASPEDGKRRAQVFAPAAVLAKPVNFEQLAASLDGHPASESA